MVGFSYFCSYGYYFDILVNIYEALSLAGLFYLGGLSSSYCMLLRLELFLSGFNNPYCYIDDDVNYCCELMRELLLKL